MRGIALVMGAVNVILKQLSELPDGPEARALREKAHGYIREAAMWNMVRSSVEVRPRAQHVSGLEAYGCADLGQSQVARCSVSTPKES